MEYLSLNGNWDFRALETNAPVPPAALKARQWMPAVVPGTVHTDLMANAIIPDPFVGMNERDVQWVGSQQWAYRRKFTVTKELLRHDAVLLVCEGLDTYAALSINGKPLAKTSNMFVEHRLDAKRLLTAGENSVEVLFDPAISRARAIEKENGSLRVALEPHRVYVRKAQYSFGWDWGPSLPTAGIWRSMSLQAFNRASIADPFFSVIALRKNEAVVEVTAEVRRFRRSSLSFRVRVTGEGTEVERTIPLRGARLRCRLRIPDPKLWWPNGYGDQPLYTGTVSLIERGIEIASQNATFALRRVALIQERDSEGKSFVISVNGVKIFCKGADWIPSDSFIPRIPESTYATLLRMACEAHMNMIRVWGGGIYEQDVFYETCDRLGLMVWQDFMFACGEYPDKPWFLRAVADEASKVVRRLRNHPAIVVWCGNNECEWLFCTENPAKRPDAMTGATIFHTLLPGVCRKLDGTRIYWRSSPFGDGFPNAESNGTRHQWSVWSKWMDFDKYEQDTGRFVAEFGFQAPATRKTLEEVIPPASRHPQSAVMEHHNKQTEGPERLYRFQAAHHRVAVDFADFILKAQLVQAEALKRAVEHWRRRKFKTSGSLFWQLNDCWPVSSWSVVDSGLRPKAAYFYAKRFFAPLLVSFKRMPDGYEVWLTSDLRTGLHGQCSVSARSFDGNVIWEKKMDFLSDPDVPSVILKVPDVALAGIDPARHYLIARCMAGNNAGAENRLLLAEPKHSFFPRPGFTLDVAGLESGKFSIRVRASAFAKDVHLECSGLDAAFDDNFFDLDAGGEKVVLCSAGTGLRKFRRRLVVASLI
jgi:beta-mannosidase